MLVGRSQLLTLLMNNVCEVKFARRVFKPGAPPTRRMLCTNSFTLLNSENGRLTLNFRPTSNFQPYNPAVKNLIIVWDIFMQSWRMVSMDNCSVIKSIPRDEFWDYFNENIYTMTTEQKNQFMGR